MPHLIRACPLSFWFECCEVAVEVVRAFTIQHKQTLDCITFVCYIDTCRCRAVVGLHQQSTVLETSIAVRSKRKTFVRNHSLCLGVQIVVWLDFVLSKSPPQVVAELTVAREKPRHGHGSLLNGRSPCHLQCMMFGRLTHIFPLFLETVK